MATIRTLRVPCVDADAAEKAAAFLRASELDTKGTDDRYVLVPAGWSPWFVWALAEVLGDYCIDAELARWAEGAATAGLCV